MRRAAHAPVVPLTVDRAPDGAYVLHALTPDGVVPLGTHANVVDVWTAIDALDSPAEHTAQLAQAA